MDEVITKYDEVGDEVVRSQKIEDIEDRQRRSFTSCLMYEVPYEVIRSRTKLLRKPRRSFALRPNIESQDEVHTSS